MRTIECWRVDSVGKPRNSFVARFTSQEEAERAMRVVGGRILSEETITIYETAVEFDPQRFDKASRESGLSKLSRAEKAALGLCRFPDCPE